jgi:hypothetical protein
VRVGDLHEVGRLRGGTGSSGGRSSSGTRSVDGQPHRQSSKKRVRRWCSRSVLATNDALSLLAVATDPRNRIEPTEQAADEAASGPRPV